MSERNFKEDLAVMLSEGIGIKKNLKFQFITSKEVKESPVEELGVSNRAANALKREKIYTMGELIKNYNNISRFRNIGIKTVMEIKNALLQWYYDFISDDEVKEFWDDFIADNC